MELIFDKYILPIKNYELRFNNYGYEFPWVLGML